jgi:hypothetical protein
LPVMAVHIFPPRTSFTILKAAAANPAVAITAQNAGMVSIKNARPQGKGRQKTHVGVVPLGEPTSRLLRNLLVQIFAALRCPLLVSARPRDGQEKRALFKSFDVMR